MIEKAVMCEHCDRENWFEEERFEQIIKDGVVICKYCDRNIDVSMHNLILQLGRGRSLDD